jgi:hypothetical protein
MLNLDILDLYSYMPATSILKMSFTSNFTQILAGTLMLGDVFFFYKNENVSNQHVYSVICLQKCVAMCMDRYMDAWNLVSKAYSNRLQRERHRV